MTVQMSESLKRRIEQHGPYVLMKTLLGGEPDINRRTIYDLRTMEAIQVYNYDMAPWTAEDEAKASAHCKELNDQYFKIRDLIG